MLENNINMSQEIRNLIEMADKVIIREDLFLPPFHTFYTIKENGKFLKTDFNLEKRLENLEILKIKNNADDLTSIILKDDHCKTQEQK